MDLDVYDPDVPEMSPHALFGSEFRPPSLKDQFDERKFCFSVHDDVARAEISDGVGKKLRVTLNGEEVLFTPGSDGFIGADLDRWYAGYCDRPSHVRG